MARHRARPTLRVRPLVKDGQVLITFALDGGLTDEMKAVVQERPPHGLHVYRRTQAKAPAWVDRTVASVVVSTSVDYDNLTRRHTVSQSRNGRVEQSFVLEDPAQVAQMVTNFDRLPLFDTKLLEPNREYYILVRATRGCAATSRSGRGRVPRAASRDSRSSPTGSMLVYSTDGGRVCPKCGWPQRDCQCSSRRAATEAVPARVVAKLRMEKKGRGGKTVTVVFGLPNNEPFLKTLCSELKKTCGCGGAITEDGVELQGELRDRVRAYLEKKGFLVKG